MNYSALMPRCAVKFYCIVLGSRIWAAVSLGMLLRGAVVTLFLMDLQERVYLRLY